MTPNQIKIVMQTIRLLCLGWLVWGLSSCKTAPNAFQQKLQAIQRTLAHPQVTWPKVQEDIISSIRTEVQKNGYSRDGKVRIQISEQLHARTQAMADTLQYWQDKLRQYPLATNNPVRRLLWHNEAGRKLVIQINQHVNWLVHEHQNLVDGFTGLARRDFAVKEEQTNLDKFTQLHFAYGSVASVQALLSFWQNTLWWYELKILKKLRTGDLSTDCCYFPKVEMGVSTQSDLIKLGETYQANLFVAYNGSNANPRFTYNGTPIKVNDGIAQVRFKAGPISDTTQTDRVTRHWEGSVTLKSRGRDTTLSVRVPYTVLRKSAYHLPSKTPKP